MTHIYWSNAKPDDFINATLGDWIQGAGDITTNFELDFIHSFGKFLKEKEDIKRNIELHKGGEP